MANAKLVFFVRAISATASLGLNILVSFLYPPEFFGLFVYFLSSVNFISVFFRFGLDKYSVRIMSGLDNKIDLGNALGEVLKIWCFWLSLALPVFFLLGYIFEISHYQMVWFGLCSFFVSLNFIVADWIRSSGRINAGVFIGGALIPIISAFFVLIYSDFESDYKSIYLFISLFSCLIGLYFVFFVFLRGVRPFLSSVFFKWSHFRNSGYLMIHGLAVVGQQTLPVIIGAIFISYEELGYYQYSFLISMIVGFIPLFQASLYEQRLAQVVSDKKKVDKVMMDMKRNSIRLVFVSLVITTIVWNVLNLLDVSFYWDVTLALVLSQVINVVTNRLQIYSMTISSPWVVSVASSFCVMVTCLFIYILNDYGVFGLACSVLIGVVSKSILLYSFVKS